MTTLAEIDRAIQDKHLLTHPFYKAWTDGTLPLSALREYARQYFAFEVRLPRFLTALHSRTEDRATRATLLGNAWDEEHGTENHAELWLRFAESLGLSREEVMTATANASTQALVDTYKNLSERAPVAAGIAALYAYESQLPAVADAKICGLEKHFGFEDAAKRGGLTFFKAHRTIDVAHAAAEREALERGDASGALDGARSALTAWWDFLTAFVPEAAAA
jgi:pyrroloquinoline-quinone synthase